MITRIPGRRRATLGADKGYDTQDFVARCRQLGVTPHIAQHTTKRRSAINARTTHHAGYAVSQRLLQTCRGSLRVDENDRAAAQDRDIVAARASAGSFSSPRLSTTSSACARVQRRGDVDTGTDVATEATATDADTQCTAPSSEAIARNPTATSRRRPEVSSMRRIFQHPARSLDGFLYSGGRVTAVALVIASAIFGYLLNAVFVGSVRRLTKEAVALNATLGNPTQVSK